MREKSNGRDVRGSTELLIRQRLRTLDRALPAAQQGNPAAIHQARVATRRLREALPLVASGPAGRKLQRRVRGLTRALGPVRELDVALQMLDEFEGAGDISVAASECLRRAIGDERQRLLEEMIPAVERSDPEKLSRKAIAAARARDEQSVSPRTRAPNAAAAAERRAARRAERLRAAMANAAGMYLPDRLHEVRIAVKKLRYALEIVSAPGPRRTTGTARSASPRARAAAAALRTLKRAQVLLGRMHDLEVLITRTRAVQGSSRAPDLRLSGDLDGFVRRLEMECRQLHAQYIALRPALLEVCTDAAKVRRRSPAA